MLCQLVRNQLCLATRRVTVLYTSVFLSEPTKHSVSSSRSIVSIEGRSKSLKDLRVSIAIELISIALSCTDDNYIRG